MLSAKDIREFRGFLRNALHDVLSKSRSPVFHW